MMSMPEDAAVHGSRSLLRHIQLLRHDTRPRSHREDHPVIVVRVLLQHPVWRILGSMRDLAGEGVAEATTDGPEEPLLRHPQQKHPGIAVWILLRHPMTRMLGLMGDLAGEGVAETTADGPEVPLLRHPQEEHPVIAVRILLRHPMTRMLGIMRDLAGVGEVEAAAVRPEKVMIMPENTTVHGNHNFLLLFRQEPPLRRPRGEHPVVVVRILVRHPIIKMHGITRDLA